MRASGRGKERERPSDIQGSSGAFPRRDKRALPSLEPRRHLPRGVDFPVAQKPVTSNFAGQAVSLSKKEEDRAVQAATDNGMYLLELRRNRNFTMLANTRVVTAAVGQKGNALQYSTESHQNNEDIVLAAINSAPSAFQWASARLSFHKRCVCYWAWSGPMHSHGPTYGQG